MSDTELAYLSIAEAAKLIERRALSPVELTGALLARIDAFDREINAFNTLLAERALEQAKAAEAEIVHGRYRGRMHGIPFALKDVYDTAGILTSGYSRAYLRNVSARDATAVAKLYASGAVLIGKLATHELANGGPSFDLPWPPARNPWKTTHFTGGSSTGAGAALAAGFVPAALGTDTSGSIRIPAALCGIVGLKPTFGLVSRAGVIPHSASFDHCGPLARSVEDCAILLEAIAGPDERDPSSAAHAVGDYAAALNGDIRGVRIGVLRHLWEEDARASEDVRRAMDEAIAVLVGLGARVEDVRIPPLQRFYDVKTVITKPEVFSAHRGKLVERIDDFGSDFLSLTLAGCLFSGFDYLRAQTVRARLASTVASLMSEHDVLLTPGSGPAPPLAAVIGSRVMDHWRRPNYETVFNVTRAPALALCNGYTAEGLPLGMQIAGRAFDELAVLQVAHAYERATAWRSRRPPLLTGTPLAKIPIAPSGAQAGAVPTELRDHAAAMAKRAGLNLGAERFAQLCAIAPLALDAAARVGSCSEESG